LTLDIIPYNILRYMKKI